MNRRNRRLPRLDTLIALGALFAIGAGAAFAGSLESSLGRNELRIYSAGFVPAIGQGVAEIALADRLNGLGYERVHRRPEQPGEFFWGHEIFWWYRRLGSQGVARLVGWQLSPPEGRIIGFLPDATTDAKSAASTEPKDAPRLERKLLATSFDERRAEHAWIALDELPEHSWRALLAIEDARFFDHHGVDGRGVARALLANVKSGGVVQGGSTITQQLIKLRDLTPKRSLGRKASEALRALALEAEHSKEEILEAYLNLVYYGHLDGLALYGIDAAARAYYSTPANELTLAQSAALAALVQGPNRLSPLRHSEALADRFERVLAKLSEHRWAEPQAIRRAAAAGLPTVRSTLPRPEIGAPFRRWIQEQVGRAEPGARPGGRSIETTLDPHLQQLAERAVRRGLEKLRERRPALREQPLQAALLALDATTGEVVAYVSGDPAIDDSFDRARLARRQPGSTVKPLVALEAFESCGSKRPLFPSRRVADAPLTLHLESGDWSPQNSDRRFRGPVSVRTALGRSLNVPLVRIARHCGFAATAKRFRRSGLDVPQSALPAFVLGAIETTPLKLASAYAALVNGGRLLEPHAIQRTRRLLSGGRRRRRVSSATAAYLVFDQLRTPDLGRQAFGKTGTSSDRRDAWYAGGSGRLVTVVWVGLDDNRTLGFGGASAAQPIWRDFASKAAPSLQPLTVARPSSIVEVWVDPDTGLRLSSQRAGAERYLFDRRHQPPLRRLWRRRSPLAVID